MLRQRGFALMKLSSKLSTVKKKKKKKKKKKPKIVLVSIYGYSYHIIRVVCAHL